MRSAILSLLLAVPPLFSAVAARAAPGYNFSPEVETELSAGATSIYLLDFAAAEAHLERALQLRPDHPAPYFFRTMLTWYRLSYDSLLYRNPALEKLLHQQASQTIERAKAYAEGEQTEGVGYLYWGGALGAEGWYYFSRRQWVRAYLSGKKGYEFMLKALDAEPELYDACLGVGMFEYYAATLGPALKVLASFFIKGDRMEALRSLQKAQGLSRYVKIEAAYFLWNAALDERRSDEAQAKIDQLVRLFPRSPLFRWGEVQTLFYQKKWDAVLRKGEEYLALAYAGPQPEHYHSPFELLLSKVYYHMGLAAYNLNNLQLAKFCYERAIDQPSDFGGWKAMAYLRRGELFDLEGKREDALGKYRTVMRLPEVWRSHKLARARIRKPLRRRDLESDHVLYSPLELWREELD